MLLTKANTITFEGSRLQPRDMLDASRHGIRHQPHVGGKGEPDEWTNRRPSASNEASADLL